MSRMHTLYKAALKKLEQSAKGQPGEYALEVLLPYQYSQGRELLVSLLSRISNPCQRFEIPDMA